MKKNSFSGEESLKKSELIKRVFDKGFASRCKLTTVFLLRRDCGPDINRAAFSSSRHLHNKKAVVRNRIKRVLKAAYRHKKHLLSPRYDIVILATGFKPGTKSTDIEKELAYVFKKYSEK